MAIEQLSHVDHKSVGRVLNLPNAVDPQEPVTLAQLTSAVEGLAWKDSVRVSTQGNISLASPGASIDGVTMDSNNNLRVLVRAQTTLAENGIYIWNGAAVPMTRAPDASTAEELEAATVSVESGTNAGTTYRQTSVDFTLGTGDVVWSTFGTSAPSASTTTAGVARFATQAETDAGTVSDATVTPATLKASPFARKSYTAVIGDGVATQYDVVHSLGTRRVNVAVRRNSGNYDRVLVEDRSVDANTTRLIFASAPANNSFEVTVSA